MKKIAIFLLCIGAAIMFSVSISLTIKACSNDDKNNSAPYQSGEEGEWTGNY